MTPPTPAAPAATSTATARQPRKKRYWKVPAGLILLSVVPVIAGAARITELAAGPEVTEANARFISSPSPVLIHIIAASIYCILGALQFVPSLRRGPQNWHRKSGRLLAPLGLLAALSGVWMTLFYAHPDGANTALLALRLFFGLAMAGSIVAGVLAVVRRDIPGHSAWMTRAYAIGLGAGTQVFTHLPWVVLFGAPDKTTTAILMGLGWAINVAVAEYVIRRRRGRPAPRNSGVSAPSQRTPMMWT